MTRAARSLLPALLAGAFSAGGCESEPVHTFSAFHYDPDGDCLDGAAIVEVVSGPEPAPCAVLRCWEDPSSRVYVTDAACAGPLDFADHTGDVDGPCPKALAAYARPDHGRCPAPPGDAGP